MKKSPLKLGAEAFFSPAISLALGVAAGSALHLTDSVSTVTALVFGPAGLAAAGLAIWRGPRPWRAGMGVLALFLLGLLLAFGRAEQRVAAAAAIPAIDTRGEAVRVEGWLAAIETSGSGRSRLLVRIAASGAEPGYRIRVLGSAGEVRPGESVAVEAVLAPPRMAAVPGGYDFAFHAFFRRIAATGYAIAPARAGPADLRADRLQRRIAALRWTMAERITRRLEGRSGALAAALLTGDRSRLAREDVEALRGAGLGHMLAISGMHMALFAGGVFFAVRLAAAGLGRWSRRHDPAVPAALAALAAAAIYLALSGGAIPTQRAFIMTASALGAVLARRRVLSFHTLAIAMTAVLVLTPEAVVTPGFQMSFAAVGALIAAAQLWQARRPPPAPLDAGRGVRQFFGGLGTTSLVAGLATSGFGAFHFHRVAAFGLVGNLLVMPVFTLIVMPAGILALFLMPAGLDGVPLMVMGAGLDLVLALAHTVSGWPGAERTIPSAPGWVLALYGSGFALACAARGGWRGAGAGLMAAAIAFWATADRPDLFISRDGVIVARGYEAGGEAGGWAVSDARRSRFPVRVFLEGEGRHGRPGRLALDCDAAGCAGTFTGDRPVVVLDALDGLSEDCRRAGLIVTRQVVPAHRIRGCGAPLIDAGALSRRGGAMLWAGPDGDWRVRHVLDTGPRQPWHARTVSGAAAFERVW
ncbi:MAG: ComEC/Rec2 family competence protein [Pseudomonadota bacterium]|nr:ComEC/Rec2 family competence protein [Pseudomonadota bacterium]